MTEDMKEAVRLLFKCTEELRKHGKYYGSELDRGFKERLHGFLIKHGFDNPEFADELPIAVKMQRPTMAKLLVCDRCNTQDNVAEASACDLCPSCAIEVIKGMLANETMRACVLEQVGMAGVPGQMKPPTTLPQEGPVGAVTMTPEAQIRQRRSQLFIQHGEDVYMVQPKEEVSVGAKIRYGEVGRESLIEIVAQEPCKPGWWWAKKAGGR